MTDTDFLDSIIRSQIMSMHIMAKAEFNNAADTRALLLASEKCGEALIQAVDYRLRERVDQLIIERLSNTVNENGSLMRVGNKWYEVKEK